MATAWSTNRSHALVQAAITTAVSEFKGCKVCICAVCIGVEVGDVTWVWQADVDSRWARWIAVDGLKRLLSCKSGPACTFVTVDVVLSILGEPTASVYLCSD